MPTNGPLNKENALSHPSRLMNRNFILLWQGQAISQMGSQLSMIAMLFWIKHATESPALMGGMTMTSGLVGVLLSPVGGAFADRYSRRFIIIICDLISGLAVFSLSFWMWLRPRLKGGPWLGLCRYNRAIGCQKLFYACDLRFDRRFSAGGESS